MIDQKCFIGNWVERVISAEMGQYTLSILMFVWFDFFFKFFFEEKRLLFIYLFIYLFIWLVVMGHHTSPSGVDVDG